MQANWVLATNNNHKLNEVRAILNPHVNILSLSDINCQVNPEESGTTFRENALIKAAAVAKFTDYPVISDDSGLCVSALQGRPGINSSRYAGNNATDSDNVNKLLSEMEGITDRSAFFIACICLLRKNQEPLFFEGHCYGNILHSPLGNAGFGYDPVFQPLKSNLSFAEIDSDTKNKISHRAEVLKKVKNHILTHLV
jgi:XTP/dITP diphosphohydrolase